MLIDEVEISIKAGHGGPGKISFSPTHKKAGPDGGNGGKGGDVYIRATSDLAALNRYSREKEIVAQNGTPGESNKRSGSGGEDLEILMPVGSELVDKDSGEVFELKKPEERILICKGGLGGRGNFEFRSSRRTTPRIAQPGLPGQERKLKVYLKFIADFGLIGLPNVGKSSLLNELTKANVKVADYEFTTLEPNLGVFNGKIIADIPGLIEGASSGKGLGIKFLKHIEKVKLLLHCISATSRDAVDDYRVVRQELKSFSQSLMKKKEIILLTRADLASPDQLKEVSGILKKTIHKRIIVVSIHDWDSIERLKKLLN